MSSRLPSEHLAWVEEKKIKEYLLNVTHVQGGPKAKFFLKRGFSANEWEAFHEALVVQGKSNPVVKETPNEFGTRFVVECNCPTPDQLNPCIRTVWELKEDEVELRLITAHPIDIS